MERDRCRATILNSESKEHGFAASPLRISVLASRATEKLASASNQQVFASGRQTKGQSNKEPDSATEGQQMTLRVECCSRRKADGRPIRFQMDGHDYFVEEMLDQWYGPE